MLIHTAQYMLIREIQFILHIPATILFDCIILKLGDDGRHLRCFILSPFPGINRPRYLVTEIR